MSLALLRRIPFTLAMALAVIVVACVTGSTHREVDPSVPQRWGFAIEDLWTGRLYKVATGIVFTNFPRMLLAILILIPFTVGAYEWLAGTRRALLVYWTIEFIGALTCAPLLFVLLRPFDPDFGYELLYTHEVGMSGGGFGCLGAAVHRLRPPWRRRVFLGFLLYLLVRLATLTKTYEATLHLLSFFAGLALERATLRGNHR